MISMNNIQGDISLIIKSLQKNVNIVHLDVANINLETTQQIQILKFVEASDHLYSLDISNKYISFRNKSNLNFFSNLKNLVKNNKILQFLNLESQGLGQ